MTKYSLEVSILSENMLLITDQLSRNIFPNNCDLLILLNPFISLLFCWRFSHAPAPLPTPPTTSRPISPPPHKQQTPISTTSSEGDIL